MSDVLDHTEIFIEKNYAHEDDALRGCAARAEGGGVPAISVNPTTGRLLQIITSMVGAKDALEVGTLAGYSGTWIARGLRAGGRLTTLEIEPKHAAVASETFRLAGVADRVEIKMGAALDTLAVLEREGRQFDLVFLDAIKAEYSDYFRFAHKMLRPGGVLLGDNVLKWGGDVDFVAHPDVPDDERGGLREMRSFLRSISEHPDYSSTIIRVGSGVLVAHRRHQG
jgi:predicted O-methyltransferase YrrM